METEASCLSMETETVWDIKGEENIMLIVGFELTTTTKAEGSAVHPGTTELPNYLLMWFAYSNYIFIFLIVQ